MFNAKEFFSKDNGIIKFASWLILFPSLLALAKEQFPGIPNQLFLILSVVSGVAALAGNFLQKNRTYTTGFWINFAYTLVLYLAGNPDLTSLAPESQPLLAFLGTAFKLISPFTTQESADVPTPPAPDKATDS